MIDEEQAAVYEYSLAGPDQRLDLLERNELTDLGPPLPGKLHGAPVRDERDHFYACPSCGQEVDMRDLRQVIWHEEPGHEPLEPQPEAKVIEFPKRK
ncbi:hypothetical protein NKJ59_14995 [Mesorhizobium australicum]|uniref:hypothetical protein n=1 Tax=Mesorhizobium australicum TaxID=536018 RepID=UPI003334CCAB